MSLGLGFKGYMGLGFIGFRGAYEDDKEILGMVF